MKREYEEALAALARAEGRNPDELLAEMLRSRVQGAAGAPRELPAQTAEAPRAELVRQPVALSARHAGVPAPQTEEQAEALERWLEAEAGPSGIFGDGGMTAGGIFGGEAVATQGYDPNAEQRSRTAALARAAPALVDALRQQRAPVHYQPPPPPEPVQHVRMVQTVTVYEGPVQAGIPRLPWPWNRR